MSKLRYSDDCHGDWALEGPAYCPCGAEAAPGDTLCAACADALDSSAPPVYTDEADEEEEDWDLPF